MITIRKMAGVITLSAALLVLAGPLRADEFSEQDLKRWEQQFQDTVQKGRSLWTSGTELGSNGVACAQCHPNAANTHPKPTRNSRSRLAASCGCGKTINWCIRNPFRARPWR